MIFRQLIIIFGMLFFSYYQLDCQESCFPDNIPIWNDGYHDFSLDIFEGSYRVRVKEGTSDLEFDWSTFENDSELSDGAMKALLEATWVLTLAPRTQHPFNFIMNVHNKVDCFATLRYVVKLDENQTVLCCDEGASIAEDIYLYHDGYENHWCYNVSKSVKCGHKCCRRGYAIEYVWYDNLTPPQYMPKIASVISEEMSSCGTSTEYLDCLTGEPLPCEGNSCP
jgi:hypothetical protein